MYSQNDEEVHILASLPDNGTFLDIGAYDGRTFSNTLRLVEKGWRGFCVEPSPPVFNSLFNLHKNNPNVTCILAAITHERESKMSPFFDSNGDAIGTLNPSHVEKWSGWTQFNRFVLWTVPLCSLLSSLQQDYEFVNIDVEGNSTELFREFASLYTGTRLKCVCVEYDNHLEECKRIAQTLDMKPGHITGENILFIKN